jgi:hypothetical protein
MKTVTNNPATSTAAAGFLVSFVGAQLGWGEALQAQVAQVFLAGAVLVRSLAALVGWWRAKNQAG